MPSSLAVSRPSGGAPAKEGRSPHHEQLPLKPAADASFDLVSLGEVMLAPRPRRRSHPHHSAVPGLGRGRRVQRRPGSQALLRPAHRGGHRLRRQRRGPPPSGPHLPGWGGPGLRSLGCRRRCRAHRSATASTSPSAASGFARPWAAPIAVTPRSPSLAPGDIDWDAVFGAGGARWLHTGGIFAALSETTPAVAKEAMTAAHAHGDGGLLRPQLPARRCGRPSAARSGPGR